MFPSTQDNPRNRTQLFSVIGPAYVPEQRHDHDHPAEKPMPVDQSTTCAAVAWLVFYAVLIGIALVSTGGAAKLLEVASLMLR